MKLMKIAAILALFALAASAAGQNTCSDPPVRLTMATYPGGTAPNLNYGVWGDGVVLAGDGGTVYQDGVSGLYAKFQVCNTSNDLIVNLGQARGRNLWWNWGHNVGTCTTTDPANCVAPPSWIATPQKSQSFFQANQVFSLVVGQTLTTWLTGNLTVSKTTYGSRWRNPNADFYSDIPNPNLDILNEPYPTALIQATRTSCTSYAVQAIPGTDALGATPWPFPVATMLVPGAKNSGMKNGGQYELPISMKVEMLARSPLDPDPACR